MAIESFEAGSNDAVRSRLHVMRDWFRNAPPLSCKHVLEELQLTAEPPTRYFDSGKHRISSSTGMPASDFFRSLSRCEWVSPANDERAWQDFESHLAPASGLVNELLRLPFISNETRWLASNGERDSDASSKAFAWSLFLIAASFQNNCRFEQIKRRYIAWNGIRFDEQFAKNFNDRHRDLTAYQLSPEYSFEGDCANQLPTAFRCTIEDVTTKSMELIDWLLACISISPKESVEKRDEEASALRKAASKLLDDLTEVETLTVSLADHPEGMLPEWCQSDSGWNLLKAFRELCSVLVQSGDRSWRAQQRLLRLSVGYWQYEKWCVYLTARHVGRQSPDIAETHRPQTSLPDTFRLIREALECIRHLFSPDASSLLARCRWLAGNAVDLVSEISEPAPSEDSLRRALAFHRDTVALDADLYWINHTFPPGSNAQISSFQRVRPVIRRDTMSLHKTLGRWLNAMSNESARDASPAELVEQFNQVSLPFRDYVNALDSTVFEEARTRNARSSTSNTELAANTPSTQRIGRRFPSEAYLVDDPREFYIDYAGILGGTSKLPEPSDMTLQDWLKPYIGTQYEKRVWGRLQFLTLMAEDGWQRCEQMAKDAGIDYLELHDRNVLQDLKYFVTANGIPHPEELRQSRAKSGGVPSDKWTPVFKSELRKLLGISAGGLRNMLNDGRIPVHSEDSKRSRLKQIRVETAWLKSLRPTESTP